MFAVKYSTVMPSEDVLRREIETQKELYRLQLADEGKVLAKTKVEMK